MLFTFFDNIFLFLKWCPIFDYMPLIQNSKINNFLWVCWFLGKIFLILYPPFESSTIRIAIFHVGYVSTWEGEASFLKSPRPHFVALDTQGRRNRGPPGVIFSLPPSFGWNGSKPLFFQKSLDLYMAPSNFQTLLNK